MTQIVSSISGIEIWAPSAGSASNAMYDKNNRDLSKCVDQQGASAIASAYQVVSATATQLYAGTAYLTGVNGTPISAARAGNAANATQATSAWYDDTGRLISALPDEVTVSAIASAYADDKLDKTAQVVTATAGDGTYVTSINGMEISGQGGGGGGDAFPVDYNSGSCSASLETGYFVSTSRPSLTLSSTDAAIYPRFIVRNGTGSNSKGSYYLSDAFEFTTGAAGGSGTKVLRVDPQQVSSKNFLLFGPSGSNTYGTLALGGADDSAYVRIGSGTEGHVNYVRPSSISSWWDVHDTVSANSATWGGGGGVVTSTASASAGDPLNPIYYVNKINGSGLLAVSADESEYAQYDTNGRLLLEIPGSAEVSAIASSYAESAASSKLDSSASSSFYTTANESGFITGVDLSDYATTGYVDSSVSGKADSSSLSSYALSSDVSGVIDTVSSNSASWGQGGVDSATVSAIASSYADNCWPISSTTINSTARDINVRWGNDEILIGKKSNIDDPHIEMGVGGFPSKSAGLESTRVFGGALGNATYRSWSLDISGVRATGGIGDGVWQYGSAEYGQLTGVYDTVSSNSASWGQGGDVYISGFSYNATDISAIEGSALYDKSAHSRITTVAGRVTNVSAAVSGTIDLVSTQSANWGGSALALSAGAGISLTLVGNTLVISTAGV